MHDAWTLSLSLLPKYLIHMLSFTSSTIKRENVSHLTGLIICTMLHAEWRCHDLFDMNSRVYFTSFQWMECNETLLNCIDSAVVSQQKHVSFLSHWHDRRHHCSFHSLRCCFVISAGMVFQRRSNSSILKVASKQNTIDNHWNIEIKTKYFISFTARGMFDANKKMIFLLLHTSVANSVFPDANWFFLLVLM